MVFIPTCSKSDRDCRSGFTLVEVLIGLLIGVLLSVAIVRFSMFSGKSLASLFNYADMQYSSRKALDILSRDVRQSAFLQSFATNKITLMDYDGTVLAFEYSPTNQTLVRIKGGTTNVLLTDCDQLTFSIYKRTPISGTFDHDPSVNPASAKVIGVSWNCSRPLLGNRIATANMDGAKIVVRK